MKWRVAEKSSSNKLFHFFRRNSLGGSARRFNRKSPSICSSGIIFQCQLAMFADLEWKKSSGSTTSSLVGAFARAYSSLLQYCKKKSICKFSYQFYTFSYVSIYYFWTLNIEEECRSNITTSVDDLYKITVYSCLINKYEQTPLFI